MDFGNIRRPRFTQEYIITRLPSFYNFLCISNLLLFFEGVASKNKSPFLGPFCPVTLRKIFVAFKADDISFWKKPYMFSA